MSTIQQAAIDYLRASREALLAYPKERMNGAALQSWFNQWDNAFRRAGLITGGHINIPIFQLVNAYHSENNHEVAHEVQVQIVGYIDMELTRLNSQVSVKPILDDYIARISDTKLATLLRELNSIRTQQPNLAAIGFRTVLALIIRERAKRVNLTHKLATQDIDAELAIKTAIGDPQFFSDGERRLLKRCLSGGNKDTFDIVAHKPGVLIQKDQLEDAVNLLNSLLPTIV